MRKSFSSLLFVLLVGGCAASGSARYSASVTTPNLVYVSPGVQVIEDYDEPIFYSSNMYWRYDGGVWYQSRYHTSGWVRVASPPAPIQVQTKSRWPGLLPPRYSPKPMVFEVPSEIVVNLVFESV